MFGSQGVTVGWSLEQRRWKGVWALSQEVWEILPVRSKRGLVLLAQTYQPQGRISREYWRWACYTLALCSEQLCAHPSTQTSCEIILELHKMIFFIFSVHSWARHQLVLAVWLCRETGPNGESFRDGPILCPPTPWLLFRKDWSVPASARWILALLTRSLADNVLSLQIRQTVFWAALEGMLQADQGRCLSPPVWPRQDPGRWTQL